MSAGIMLTAGQVTQLRAVVADPLTTAQVAALAYVSPRYVRAWATRHGITGVLAHRPHRHWLYPGTEVRRAVSRGRPMPAAVARWAQMRRLHHMAWRARVGVL